MALLPLKTLRVGPLLRHWISLPSSRALVLLTVVVEVVNPQTSLFWFDFLGQELLHLLLLTHRYLESPVAPGHILVRIHARTNSRRRRMTHVMLSVLRTVLGGRFIIFVGPGQLRRISCPAATSLRLRRLLFPFVAFCGVPLELFRARGVLLFLLLASLKLVRLL